MLNSSRFLFIHVHGPGWKPALWVLVVEGPRRDNDKKRQSRASKPDVDCPSEVLEDEADEPRGNLKAHSAPDQHDANVG